MKEKKKYEKPEAEIVAFVDDEIITISAGDQAAGVDEGEDF